MTNQIVLGKLIKGRFCAIHRQDSTGAWFPVKYWPEGPDGYGNAGWYWFDSDGGMDEGFTSHSFFYEPHHFPMFTAYDPEYKSVILLVLVPGDYYTLDDSERGVIVKPATPEQISDFVKNFEW